MIVQFENNSSTQQRLDAADRLLQQRTQTRAVRTQYHDYLVAVAATAEARALAVELEGVSAVYHLDTAYKLVSRTWKSRSTTIDLGDGVAIGPDDFAVIAGPCSIESEEQIHRIVDHLVKRQVKIMRGGVFKPRSSPYAFRGLGMEGLILFHSICQSKGIKIISEVMDASQIEEMAPYVDIFQVGARNAQNYNLLDALGRVDQAVLIKRGIAGTIEELLQAAEYVYSGGNEKIILCERGIRSYETAYRNTFDINAIPILKEKTHLPVLADPSHGIGLRKHVPRIALAALAAGADGMLTELHYQPEIAFSDGQQTLNFEEFDSLLEQIQKMKAVFYQ